MGSVKLLKASAGSGKTYRLAYEYVRTVIAESFMYRHILAVTFTNKATEEMKRRILDEIDLLGRGEDTGYMKMLERDLSMERKQIATRAKQALTAILHDYSRFSVLTIDKFFQRIIRSFVRELGIDLNFNLELRTDTLLSSAADALVDEISLNESLREWILGFVRERIAENKKWDIRSGLVELGGEIFGENYKRSASLAVSREELEKIVSQYSARSFAAQNAMKAKASKALSIMDGHGLQPMDFPFGKASFANYFTKVAAGKIEAPGKRVADALVDEAKWYSKTSPHKDRIIAAIPELMPLLEDLTADYERNIEMFNTAELLRENFRNFALLTDLARKIEDKCATEGILPISETNRIINKLIAGNDAPFIFEKVGNHFSRFMIDEFQDTSSMQWENFIPLLRNSLSQAPGDSVLLVGDVKQAIYRWRGGDWQILSTEIEKTFGNVRSEELATNYRSLDNVVRFNNELIRTCVEADNSTLNHTLEEAAAEKHITKLHAARLNDMLRLAYSGHEQAAVGETDTGYVNVTYYKKDDDGKKAPPVIRRIEELQQRGYSPSDIAILVRYNAEGVEVANMLLEHKKRNPGSPYSYDVVTQEALLVGSAPVVRFLCACLRISYDSSDRLNRAIFNNWFGRSFGAELTGEDIALFESLRIKPLLEAFESLVMYYGLGDKPEQATYIQALEDQIIEFSKNNIADIPLFLKWWEDNGAMQSVNVPEGGSAITIITIHKAKGLQYKAVIIPYCDWKLTPNIQTVLWSQANDGDIPGVVPVRYKEKMRRSAFAADFYDELVLSHIDNINTLYVALTRAREELYIMIPDPAKSTSDRVGSLISTCIRESNGTAAVGTMLGQSLQEDSLKVMEFGITVDKTNDTSAKGSSAISVPFRSYDVGNRLRIKSKVARYIEDGASLSTSPREAGILMHKAFEAANDKESITLAIEAMLFNGEISDAEVVTIRERIDESFENPIISSWFSGEWEVVRSESTIIIPGNAHTRRPDRVMIKGSRAVVVDYKFGLNRPASYSRQLHVYMDLLKEMGYTDTEGYIWYVAAGEIEKVI